MADKRTIPLIVTERQLNAILAGLLLYQRFEQADLDVDELPSDAETPLLFSYPAWFIREVCDAASHDDKVEPLCYAEVKALCRDTKALLCCCYPAD